MFSVTFINEALFSAYVSHMYSVEKVRQDFPILAEQDAMEGKAKAKKRLIYLDSACMSLRPRQVLEAQERYYEEFPACGERSMHRLSQQVDAAVRDSRRLMQRFLNARKAEEIVFTWNTTFGLNLVYNSLGLTKGDVIITTDKEHNSNLLPALEAVRNRGCVHTFPESRDDGAFDLEAFGELMGTAGGKAKLVSVVHTSNLDGTTVPLKEITKIAHENNAVVMADAAQSVPHKELDVKRLGVDFLAFSGHKMLGPGGTGVLYGKYDMLDSLEPFVAGGGTVFETTYSGAKWEAPPARFEAGLQNYPGIIGLGEAAGYLTKLGMDNVSEHEQKLNAIVTDELAAGGGRDSEDSLTLLGPRDAEKRSGIFSFNVKGVDSHTVAGLLDKGYGIAVRAGAHCVHSWFSAHGLDGSVRASFYLYNTEQECHALVEGIRAIMKNFTR